MRVFNFVTLALLGLIVTTNVTTVANAQSEPQIVNETQPDAGGTQATADHTDLHPLPGNIYTGIMTAGNPGDADAVQYQPLSSKGWSIGGVAQAYLWPRRSTNNSTTSAELYIFNNGQLDYSTYSNDDLRPSVSLSIDAADQNTVVVAPTGSLVNNNRNDINPGFSNIAVSYEIAWLPFRPHLRQQSLTDINVYDAAVVDQVLDCSQDIYTYRYTDLDLNTFGEAGEQLVAAILIPRSCFHVGLTVRSNTYTVTGFVDPATGDDYLVRNEGGEIDLLPFAEFQQYRPWAAGYAVGQLASDLPASVQSVVMYIGLVANNQGNSFRMSSENPTEVLTARSAYEVRESFQGIEIVNPSATVSDLSVTATTPDRLVATTAFASAHQIDAHTCTATRLQAGARFGDPAGSVISTVTDLPGDPSQAHVWLHTDEVFSTDIILPVFDLQPGDQVEVTCTPQARALYGTTPLESQSRSLVYTAQITTDTGDGPSVQLFELRVFPNPAIGGAQVTLAISSATTGDVQFTVFDTVGRQIANGRVQVTAGETQIPLDLTGVTPGVYVVHATTDVGEIATQRLTVVR